MNNSRIEKTIAKLGTAFNADERETSILHDHHDQVVYIETSHPATARRLFEYFKEDEDVKFCERSDTLKMTLPWAYCRQPDLIILPSHRKAEQTAEAAV